MHLHDRHNRNTLVYWLEFKDDEEFPGTFGSISGGSALKFGLYRSAATHKWMGPGSGASGQEISLEEAIQIARRHRDQLLLGHELLKDLPDQANDQDYVELQEAINQLAPDVSNLAWGHGISV